MEQLLDLSRTFVHLTNHGDAKPVELTPSFWRESSSNPLYVLTNLFEQGFNPATFILRMAYLGALTVLASTSQPRVHAVLTIACVVGLGGYIAVFTPDLVAVATEPR